MSFDKLIKKAVSRTRAKDFTGAIKYYRKILTKDPYHLDANYLLGAALAERKLYPEAERYLTAARKVKPDSPYVLANLGSVYQLRGNITAAVECLERVKATHPHFPNARNSLGICYAELGRLLEALEEYRIANRQAPGTAQYLYNVAVLSAKLGFMKQALAHYAQALEIDSTDARIHSNYLMTSLYVDTISPDEVAARHIAWGQRHPVPPAVPVAAPGERLRIGYVSPDFRNHPVGQLIAPLLREHDRSRFAVYCYSDVAKPDGQTQLIRSFELSWRETSDLSDDGLSRLIRNDGIDILVDLSGHTGNNRLGVFALRPAPVSVSYLGYPATTGLASIDYIVSDAWLDPIDTTDGRYSEELVRLPGAWFAFEPRDDCPEVSTLPATKNGYITFGALCNPQKLDDAVIELWSELLKRVPGSRLILQSGSFQDARVKQYFIGRFVRHGVQSEALELLAEMPWHEHLGVYGEIDIALDTFPWNSHMTALNALWMGVPLITVRGDARVSRMCSGILNMIGLQDLVADTTMEYLDVAISLASRPDRLAALRAELRERMRSSPFCDATAVTREFEKLLLLTQVSQPA